MARSPDWKKSARKTRVIAMRSPQGRNEYNKADASDGLVDACWKGKGNLRGLREDRPELLRDPAANESLVYRTRARIQELMFPGTPATLKEIAPDSRLSKGVSPAPPWWQ
jgi:hypothetical protein